MKDKWLRADVQRLEERLWNYFFEIDKKVDGNRKLQQEEMKKAGLIQFFNGESINVFDKLIEVHSRISRLMDYLGIEEVSTPQPVIRKKKSKV